MKPLKMERLHLMEQIALINSSKGLIGCGHPVGASNVRMFLDLYKQVAGKAEGYQLKKSNNGMMLNIGGGSMTNCIFIVGLERK